MKNLFIAALKQETEGMDFFQHIGVGKINATFNTSKLIDEFKPDLIINFGTAGAKKKGLSDPTIELISDVNRVVDLGSSITKKETIGKTSMYSPTELYNLKLPRGMRNVYKAEVDETKSIFDKHTMDQPQAPQQFNENMFTDAMQLGLDVEQDVIDDKDKRIKERIGSGIIQDDITIGDPRGYAQGGLASLKRKI